MEPTEYREHPLGNVIGVDSSGELVAVFPFTVSPPDDVEEVVTIVPDGESWLVHLPSEPEETERGGKKVEGVPVCLLTEEHGEVRLLGPGPNSSRTVVLKTPDWRNDKTISCTDVQVEDVP